MKADDRAVDQAVRAPRMESGTITSMTPDGFGFISADRHVGEVFGFVRETPRRTRIFTWVSASSMCSLPGRLASRRHGCGPRNLGIPSERPARFSARGRR